MNDKQYIPVRLSHLLLHCSVGAIFRGPDHLLVIRDIREWTAKNGEFGGRTIFYVEQVKSALGIENELREPPIAQKTERGVDGVCIPAQVFPSWMSCSNSKCGLLYSVPWNEENHTSTPYCIECKKVLQQVPWVLAHKEGYLADVPWHSLAHREAGTPNQKQCAPDWDKPYITLKSQNGKRILACNRCSANSIFTPNMRIPFLGTQEPWIKTKPAPTDELGEVLEVNDTRIHSALTQSALVIPPESRVRHGSVVDRLYSSSEKRSQLTKARTPLARKSAFQTIATDLRCEPADIESAIAEIDNGYPLYGKEITGGILLESEYQALLENIPDLSDDEDFVPHKLSDDWKNLMGTLDSNSVSGKIARFVDDVVSVSRLKEIMIFKGFQRFGEEGTLVPPTINEDDADWLPALELYGEGIFLTFNQNVLAKWEQNEKVIERTKPFVKRYASAPLHTETEVTVTPRFMLLHALSHRIIRELESLAGYPAASLKERIYSSNNYEQPMAGILIFVAVPDVVGSLGGLAELAKPARLLDLLTRAFEGAQWCSFDPVCSEHEGQGPGLLNRAACHACELVPETTCICGNVLLDRVFIKGDIETGLPSPLEFADQR